MADPVQDPADEESRERKSTEKGLQYQLDIKSKQWKSSVKAWRRVANKLRELLVDDDAESKAIKDSRDNVQTAMDKVIAAQESLAELTSTMKLADDSEDKLDEIEEEHSSLMKETLRALLILKDDSSSKSSKSKKLCQEWVNDSPKEESPANEEVHPTDAFQGNDTESKADNHEANATVSAALLDLLRMNRLPVPEPGIFSGNPLDFMAWKRSYNALIEHRGIPADEKFYFLLKYLSKEPKELVQGYSLLGNEAAYDEALKVLESRYGNPFIISNAFRDKLDAWPKIGTRDSTGLRRFGDFLRQCCTAAKNVHHLHHLDDERENKKLMSKLPDWLVTRWGRTVVKWRQDRGSFPPFSVFADFINEEAVIACDPITSQTTSLKEKRQSSSNARSFSTGTQKQNDNGTKGKRKLFCIFCKGEHHLAYCTGFKSEHLDTRRKFIFDRGLCYGCLKKGHLSKECRQRLSCSSCKKRHPTVLHDDYWNERQAKDAQDESKETQTSSSYASVNEGKHRTLKTSAIVPVWLSHDSTQGEKLVYAMLDTQSDTSFILSKTKEAMGIEGIEVNLLLSTMTLSNERIASEKISGLKVRAFHGTKEIRLPPTYTRNIMPVNRDHIPTSDTAKDFPHLKGIAAHMIPLQDCEVGLLIGYDCASAMIPRAVITSPDGDGPFGLQTDLGWSIVGTVESTYHNNAHDPIGVSHRVMVQLIPEELHKDGYPTRVSFSHQSTVREEIAPSQIIKLMEADFACDKRQRPYSRNDLKFLQIMERNVHVADNGHYEMPLPFREETPILPNNRILAEKRLDHLKRKLQSDPAYHEQYAKQMNSLFHSKYAEEVSGSGDEGKVWYIPHHGVKQPNKLRVVFDCSSQFRGTSLNSHLLSGPDLTNTLTGVLCRFRKDVVAFMCDVKEMFHQFHVNKEHRDYFRFLWWTDGDISRQPSNCRMNVHLFGATSSPGCSNFGLKQIAKDYAEEFGQDASEFVQRDFYVDDGLKSVKTEDEAVDLFMRTKQMCERGHLHLHKIVSNSRKVMQSVPVEDRGKDLKELNLLQDTLPIEKALGVQWCIESDSFRFRITFQEKPMTRRGVLSTVMSVYDPLGLLAPIILPGKVILQDLCRISAAWDDPLPDALRIRWEKWKTDILQLEGISIDRCYKPKDFGDIKNVQLHHFSDASSVGYGQCTYMRLTNQDDKVHCTLVMGKSRVAPIKTVTVPRLELTAALLSVKVSSFLQNELDLVNAEQFFWTDSRVVLGYIRNELRRYHVFVANRVSQIRDESLPAQWHHIDTKENPADGASRGLTMDQIKTSKWLTGPDFLWEKEISNDEKDNECEILPNDPEVKRSQTHAASKGLDEFELERLDRFSTWHQARRAVANCLRFKSYLQRRCAEKRQRTEQKKDVERTVMEPMSAEILLLAEKEIIKNVQRRTFKDEIQTIQVLNNTDKPTRERRRHCKTTSRLHQLDPFLDNDGIMRVGGRLRRSEMKFEGKHPAILPQCHLTELILAHCHAEVAHQGRGMTTNCMRSKGYWILGSSHFVSKFISKCVTCRRLRRSPQVQKMADLPQDRLTSAPPFTFCGMDCFGPFIIKEGRKELKRYGLLFTCMASRGIHIEVLNALTTDAFINALRRFISVRGPVRQLRSDRGTNFIGAENELTKAWKEMNHVKVKNDLLRQECDYIDFTFNFPSSSHMGGVWERQIRSVRSVLDALLHQNSQQLDDDSLRTLLCEAAAIVNSRPLSVEFLNDPTHPEPLTPNHLLTQKSRVILPPPGSFPREDVYARKRWRRVQHLANEFWNRWRKEFLSQLQSRQKWTVPKRDMKVGDIVLIKDDNVPRNVWPVARIVETYVSEDTHVRKVKVAVGDPKLNEQGKRVSPMCHLERPIHKLVLLIPSEDQA